MVMISIIKSLGMALLSSGIFYLIVVYFPLKRKNKIAVDFFIDLYKREKLAIFDELIYFLGEKNCFDKDDGDAASLYDKIRGNILNYEQIREVISRGSLDAIRNKCCDESFSQLINAVLYHLDILRSALTTILSYDFIAENKTAYARSNYLIGGIQQANYHKNTYYVPGKDDREYSRLFCGDIWDFICGGSVIKKDDFLEVIEKAYDSSLLLNKIISFF